MQHKPVQTSIFISPGFFRVSCIVEGKRIQLGIGVLTKRICYYPLLLLNRYFLTNGYYSPISTAHAISRWSRLNQSQQQGRHYRICLARHFSDLCQRGINEREAQQRKQYYHCLSPNTYSEPLGNDVPTHLANACVRF